MLLGEAGVNSSVVSRTLPSLHRVLPQEVNEQLLTQRHQPSLRVTTELLPVDQHHFLSHFQEGTFYSAELKQLYLSAETMNPHV